jgi:hypothetical protein
MKDGKLISPKDQEESGQWTRNEGNGRGNENNDKWKRNK